MISTKLASIGLAAALVAILSAVSALAAANRTFVSAAGNDTNPCTITLPCRTLQVAYNATAASGEIDVLDPANYGPLTITGPVSIQGQGWAGMSANTGAAITINAAGATDKIDIHGVVLDGFDITGTAGIQFNSGGSLTVRDSVIRNFTNDGIAFFPNAASQFLLVSNTRVSENGQNGIEINMGSSASGTIVGVLEHVELANNGNSGLLVNEAFFGPTPNPIPINVTVSDSVIVKNGQAGIDATSVLPAAITMVRNSTIANNGAGLSNADAAQTFVTRSSIWGNTGAGWSGTVSSFDDNDIFGNGSQNSAPPSINHE